MKLLLALIIAGFAGYWAGYTRPKTLVISTEIVPSGVRVSTGKTDIYTMPYASIGFKQDVLLTVK